MNPGTWCCMTLDMDLLADFFYGPAMLLCGSRLDDEALRQITPEAFPDKPYCIVRQWMVVDVLLCNSKLREVEAAGQQAVILYAQCVVEDSRGRYQPGDWLYTSWSNSFEDCFFESQDTLYVLAGRGARKQSSLPAIALLRETEAMS